MHFPRVFLTSQRTNRNLYTTRRKINAMTLVIYLDKFPTSEGTKDLNVLGLDFEYPKPVDFPELSLHINISLLF